MTEKNVSVRKTAATKAVEKKAAPKRSTAKKVELEINAETVGFKAGDVLWFDGW